MLGGLSIKVIRVKQNIGCVLSKDLCKSTKLYIAQSDADTS